MKKFALSILLVFGALFPTLSNAYEMDTHFYDIYSLSRRTGFTHEYAVFFATMSQWVDEGVLSTPMGDLIAGTMLRRIWHFPDYRFKPESYTQDGHESFGFITIAEINHPVAFKLYHEGLVEGNWFKLLLALHVAADTYGHSGCPAEIGHAWLAHTPDQTWWAVDKYKKMTGTIFQMLLTLRQIAPKEALESWAIEKRKHGIGQNEYQELREQNFALNGDLIGRHYLKDPRYTPGVVKYILNLAQTKGFISKDFDLSSHLPSEEDYLLSEAERELHKNDFDIFERTRRDARDVLKNWVIKMRGAELAKGILIQGSIFNMRLLDFQGFRDLREAFEKIESSTTDVRQRIAQHNSLINQEQLLELVGHTVDQITKSEIPKKLDEETKSQFDGDGPPRQLELQLKLQDRRERILAQWGHNIEFDAQTKLARRAEASLETRLAKLRAMDPSGGLLIPEYISPILASTAELQIVTLADRAQVGTAVVKLGYNLRTAKKDVRDWVHSKLHLIPEDRFTTTVEEHAYVKGFQMADIANAKVLNGTYRALGPIGNMSLTGVSVRPSNEALITAALCDIKLARPKDVSPMNIQVIGR